MSYGGPPESPEADNFPPYIDSPSPPSPDAENPPPTPDTETPPLTPDPETPPPTPDTEIPPPTPDTETPPPTPDTENPPPTPDTENPPPPYPYPSLPPTSDAENSPPPSRPEPIPSSSGSRSMPTTSTVKIVVPVVALLLVIIVSLVVFLVIRSRRRNAANDAESQQQQTGVVNLQTAPENAPSSHNIHLMSSPAPLLQQTQTSSPAPYHSFYDSGPSGSSYNSGISDYQQQQQRPPLSSNLKTSMSPKNPFTYEELNTATNGFSMNNLLGRGGFGSVFKGVINGREVAVKKLESGSGQGHREFHAEVETISRVHHRNLVSLVGYCITEDQKLLVYEFVPNQNLERHLHDNELPTMEWSKRIKIALGSAKGLAYLHEDAQPQTIHRDIKASNILLDLNFEPKVSDFGLAKEFPENLTHVSTRIMGTFGYLAPEYASSGKLTFKSDVFSFGVVLLELITGRKPIDITTMELGLVQWAMPLINKSIQQDDYDEIVDPRLQHLGYNKDEIRRMVACAAACLRQSADSRPKMSLVMKILANDVSVDELRDSVIKSKIYTLSKKFN